MTEKELPYKLVKGVLNPAQCEAYRDWIDKYATKDQFRPGFQLASVPPPHLQDEKNTFLQPLKVVLDRVSNYFKSNYEMEHTFDMKRLFGNIMETGAENQVHDDDGDYYEGKPAVEKHYSGVLMLNSDYKGGEFFFEHHKIQLKLEEGDVIMFRGDKANLHGVRKVLEGKRYNFIFFFRDYIPTEEPVQA